MFHRVMQFLICLFVSLATACGMEGHWLGAVFSFIVAVTFATLTDKSCGCDD